MTTAILVLQPKTTTLCQKSYDSTYSQLKCDLKWHVN